jgi:hypothetical protein
MPQSRAPKQRTPVVINSTSERILKAVHEHGVLTNREITQLFFKPGSRTHAGAILRKLCGEKDFAVGHLLYRIPLPIALQGSRERVYCLGSKAREVLALEDDYQPAKLRYLAYSPLLHDVCLSRLIVATTNYLHAHPEYHVLERRVCYSISRNPPIIPQVIDGKETKVAVIPDAFLRIERVTDGEGDEDGDEYGLWIEIDRGTENYKKYKNHVRNRLELAKTGLYEKYFNIDSVLFCYIVTDNAGNTPEMLKTRLHTIRRWTEEVLPKENREAWASMFRFTTISFESIYAETQSLFEEAKWYQPLVNDTVSLFDQPNQQETGHGQGETGTHP